jgi:hypothetical protein
MKPKQGEQLQEELDIIKTKTLSLAKEFEKITDLVKGVQKEVNIEGS